MSWTRGRISEELLKIQKSVPENLRKSVIEERLKAPKVAFVIDKAIEDPNFPEEKKKELIRLKEQGHFHQTGFYENEKIAKQIDNYVNREIKKAIKDGRLPTKKKLKELGLDKYD